MDNDIIHVVDDDYAVRDSNGEEDRLADVKGRELGHVPAPTGTPSS